MGPRHVLSRARSLLFLALFPELSAPLPILPASQAAPPAPRFHAESGLETVARRLAAAPGLRAPFPGIGTLPAPMDSVDVWIVRDLGSLEDIGLGPAETWVAGVADPSTRRIGLRAERGVESSGELGPVLRHELAHIALASVTKGRAPVWLDEGFAQYASGSWGYADAWTLRLVLMRGEQVSLRRIALGFRRGESEARISYLLSYTAVHSLFERAGEDGVTTLLAALGDGASLDAALRGALGATEAQFDKLWRADVRSRYGWLFVLSRASAFWLLTAVLLIVLVAVRRRRDRGRLAALDADLVEPWEDPCEWMWGDDDLR